MKLECTKKEWSLIDALLFCTYNTSCTYMIDTFICEVGADGEIMKIEGKFIGDSCE